jgi:hypothetical protein
MDKRIYSYFSIAAILFVLLLLLSCHTKEKKLIIPEKKFVPFLVDLHLAEAIGMDSPRGLDMVYEIDSASLYGSVFEKHGITQAMFDSSMYYYIRHPEKFQRIYNDVTAELKSREEELISKQNEEEMLKGSILWQSDSVYVFKGINPERLAIDVPITGQGTYTVMVTLKMLANDASLDPRLSVYFFRDIGTIRGEQIRFQEIRYTSRTGEEKTYRATKMLNREGFSHIKGYIVNYSNADSFFHRNMVVKEILVSKKAE